MVVRLVPRGVRECRQAGSNRARERERETETKQTRKGRKNNSITEYVLLPLSHGALLQIQ